MKKQWSTLLLALLILLASTMSAHASNLNLEKQLSLPQKFRILAVEAWGSGGVQWQSAQYLIRKLMQFSNWNNSTQQYVSYIHLLSRYTKQQCITEARPFWTGNSTKANLQSEITNFLGAASPDELVIFYCITDGEQLVLGLDEIITAAELTSWLGIVKGTLCVVLDACKSGSFIDDGQGGVLGPGRIVLCSSMSYQLSWGGNVPYDGGYFTGYERIYYPPNSTYIPLGLIGGLTAGTDKNDDGWLSVTEVFDFANSSLFQWFDIQDPAYYNDFSFDPPLLLLHPSVAPVARFSFSPLNPKVNQSILFNASSSNGTITSYAWDFGDGNKTSVSQPLINHTYTQPNGYTVTLNVTDSNGLWNTTSSIVNVTIVTPVNHDAAITSISLYRTVVSNKTLTSINVTAANQGDTAEAFNVTLTYNSTMIRTGTVTLNGQNSTTITFIWNTTGLPLGNYTITATASQVPGETDTADNSLSLTIQVSIHGDINSDGKVDMKDVSKVAAGFQTHPGDAKWTANGDIDENKTIDMKDISTIAKEFGKVA